MLPSHSEPSAPPGTEINDLALSITRWCAGSLANATLQIGLSCFLHGTLTSMVMVATFLLLRKGLQNISVQILFPSTLLLYMSTTLYMVAEIWYIYSLHLMASGSADGIKSASYGTSGLVAFEAALHKQSWMFTSAVGVNVILGDGIVWWRACVLWNHRIVYYLGPILLLAMLAFGLLAIHFTPHRQLSNPVFLLRGNRMGDVAVMLSLTTNVIATSLIAIKALQHRRLLQEHLGEGYPSRTRVWRALALLVESGMIYCALLLAAVIDQIDQPTGPAGPTEPDSLFQNIITFFTYGCFVHIVAIYPVLIIVLVAMQRSPIDAGITQYLHLAADPSGTERNGERTSTLVFGPAEPGLSTFHNSMPDTIIELQARSKPQSDGQIEECATFDMGWDQGAAA